MFDSHAMLKIYIPSTLLLQVLNSLYKNCRQTVGLTEMRSWNATGPTIVALSRNKAAQYYIGQPH